MTTGLAVVQQALKKSGIIGEGETPSNETTNDALSDLNDMIATWATRRWISFREVDIGFAADGRIVPYTVGPGGNYNVAKCPNRIEKAYLRLSTIGSALPVDIPLTVWDAREQYSLATLKKSFVSFPSGVFLEVNVPTGNLYVYPWPSANMQYEIHLLLKGVLPFLALNTASVEALYPDFYVPAFKFCLARRIRQGWGKGMKPDPELNRLARETLSAVKDSNLAIPDLQTDPALAGGGVYNIYSDGYS